MKRVFLVFCLILHVLLYKQVGHSNPRISGQLNSEQLNSKQLNSKQPNSKVKLQYSVEFVFDQILSYKNKTKIPQIALPRVYFASQTPLKQFQDAVESQWGQRPKVISNVFVYMKNEIYLADDKKYYDEQKRCIDDSLAHELTHFYQYQYQKYDLNDEFLEFDAVEVQNWFREKFCKI